MNEKPMKWQEPEWVSHLCAECGLSIVCHRSDCPACPDFMEAAA